MGNYSSNKKVIITREEKNSEHLIVSANKNNIDLYFCPSIKIIPLKDMSQADKVLNNIDDYDYIVFTSKNAVEFTFNRLENLSKSISTQTIVSIGKTTDKALQNFNKTSSLMPDEPSSTGLIKMFSGIDIKTRKVLIPGSALSKLNLKKSLENSGAIVNQVAVYDVIQYDKKNNLVIENEILKKTNLYFVFTSPSAFKNFNTLYSITDMSFYKNSFICTVGNITADYIKENGVDVSINANSSEIKNIFEMINDNTSNSI